MPSVPEIARLKRDIGELNRALEAKARSKPPQTTNDRRAIKAEIETMMQQLDEIRTRLSS